MHDLRALCRDPVGFDAAMARRGLPPVADAIATLDTARRAAQTRLQKRQSRRHAIAREVAQGRRAGLDTGALEAEAVALRTAIELDETEAEAAAHEIREALERLPNRLDPSVPDGADETANLELAVHGQAPAIAGPRQHFELGEALGEMDFDAAARIAGARFTVLRGSLARLERALGAFMLDLHTTEHGYTELSVPSLVNDAAVFGTNQLPKFAEDLFRTIDGRWLIPTAEVPLTNLAAGQILDPATLPLRLTALTDCFRSEAGAAGRDTRGMMRQHQFRKVELVSITTPDSSDDEHERLTACAERVLALLGLRFRRVLLCAGDTGFGAAKTFDLEVWLPGQAAWREISSCSNTRDFQARRMNARTRPASGGAPVFVHTLNGSGVAVGRALIAVMETYQRPDGTIATPDILRPYLERAGFASGGQAGSAPLDPPLGP